MVEDLENRFPDLPQLESFSVFDPNSIPGDQEEVDGYGREKIEVNRFILLLYNIIKYNNIQVFFFTLFNVLFYLYIFIFKLDVSFSDPFRPLQNGFSAIKPGVEATEEHHSN